MFTSTGRIVLALALLLAVPIFSHAQGANKSPISVPDGTKVAPIKYGGQDTEVTLKPEEQVAFLIVYALWNLESECLEKDSGIERVCTLNELVRGMKTSDGRTIGLTVNPGRDTNYRYDLLIVGDSCMIRALPNKPALGGFGVVGSPRRTMGNFYYNPKGADLAKAEKVSEMGYGGDGFRR